MAELVGLPLLCCFAFLAMLGIAYLLFRAGVEAEEKRKKGRSADAVSDD